MEKRYLLSPIAAVNSGSGKSGPKIEHARCALASIAYIGGRIAYTILYISGILLIRSLFWNIAAFGMLAVLAAPFVPR
jgi:uncharacterized MAPEG superfamily protein